MERSKLIKIVCLLAVLLCMTAMSIAAYSGDEDSLTPEGNLMLVDDFDDSGNTTDDEAVQPGKQFITVQTRAGNYFYIIIDRSGEQENVYFLNMVDDSDLFELLEEGDSGTVLKCSCSDKCEVGAVNTNCPVCKMNLSDCTGNAKIPDVDPIQSDTEKKQGADPILIIILAAALVGGGAVYWFKFRKQKPDTKGPDDLDDYDFGEDDEDDEEEYITEDDQPDDTDEA